MNMRYCIALLIGFAALSGCHRNTNDETSYMRHLSLPTPPPTSPPTPTPPQPTPTWRALHAADSTYKVLYRFGDRDGSPNSQLLFVNDELYGTTFNAVYPTSSTVFRISTDGREKTMYQSVPSAERFNPSGDLSELDGTFYSVSFYGGTKATRDAYGTGKGGILTFNKQGKEHVLYAFKGAPDGTAPSGGLINVNGTLYGTTSWGGSRCPNGPPGGFSGCGTVYSISPSGDERVLYSFGGGEGGAQPNGSLINVDGTLYGTTFLGGGANCSFGRGEGCGTVFSISTNGKETVLYRFASCCGGDGAQPNGRLLNVNGTLYGTTHFGGRGDPGLGTVYSITRSGAERILYAFRGTSDGFYPSALIELNDKLYGTTEGGGDSTCGTLYSLTWFNSSAPAAKHILHSFACGSDGAVPESLTNVHGVLYGTTSGQPNSTLPGRETVGAQPTIFTLAP
jgi:uncharacterized repeat protein (TIGR03803 family)